MYKKQLAATYTYNVNGSRESLTYANGNLTTYGYNLANWLTGMSNKLGEEVISSFTYGYYASGNQRTETDHENIVTTYTYDGLGRLTQESSSEGKVYTYTYDANSNRASMVVTNNGVTIESVNYSYDANNRLTTEATTLLAGSETTTYTYDDNGNLLSNIVYSSANTVISSLVYTYDGFNQQASVSANSGTVTAHYTYNGYGIRASKTLGITTTEFLLDGGAVVGERTGSSVDTYLRGANLISANGEEYYLFNGHGDVVNLSNASGASAKTYEYDAFGVEQNIDELDHNPFRYCGEYFDEETGTYYLRARYYDPKRGRFTQEDTLALNVFTCSPQILLIAQVGNKYVYCANDPVMYSDPSGNKVDLSPDPRQIAIDEGSGGTPPADDPDTGGGSPGSGNANTGNAGDGGGEGGKPNLPPLPDENGSGQADTGNSGDEPVPDAFDFDEDGAESTGSAEESDGPRDVTDEVLDAIYDAAEHANSVRENIDNQHIYETDFWEYNWDMYMEFYNLVNHEAPWDIKVEASWNKTIGTAYPGFGTEIVFCGIRLTVEDLGNLTYGYLGHEYGIPFLALLGGSYYASGLRKDADDFKNEIGDWHYIAMGYLYAANGYI